MNDPPDEPPDTPMGLDLLPGIQTIVRIDRVLQYGIGKIFQNPWRSRIEDAVTRAHKCFENASFLSKLYLLTRFDTCLSANGGTFNHSVAASFTKDLKLDKEYFKHLLSIVSSLPVKRGRAFSEKNLAKIAQYKDVYQRYSDLLPWVSGENLSFSFDYCAGQLVTAYTNNVQHFDKYLKAYIRYKMDVYFVTAYQVESVNDLPVGVRPLKTKLASEMIRAVMWHGGKDEYKYVTVDNDENLQAFVENILACVRLHFIPSGVDPTALQTGISEDPIRFIPYMIYLNRVSEKMAKKLKSPLPIRSHHIPCAITIDTASLAGILLQTPEEFDQLRVFIEAKYGYNMSKYSGKDDLKKVLPNLFQTFDQRTLELAYGTTSLISGVLSFQNTIVKTAATWYSIT